MAFGAIELVIQSMLVARTNAHFSCAALHDRIEQANQRLPWARHE